MFFSADDDEQDFLSPGGSKLGALFGMDKASNTGGNESLTYTAPKQPRKKESTPPGQGGSPTILNAAAVQAYKYVDNQYANQGKLGAAILANHGASDYKILLYVSKQQQVTVAKITASFTFTIQANNYASFYDDARQSWSLMFDNSQNATQFAKMIGLAKALSQGAALSGLVSQDLTLGDGGALEAGDSAEMKYTGWLLTNNTFGQVFDTNTNADKLFRFKLGAGKVIKGWDQGVLGMKKGGKRLLVVPPSLAYGSQGAGNKVPANSTLIFEVEVVRVKIARSDSAGRGTSPAPIPAGPTQGTPSPSPSPSTVVLEDGDMDDTTVKGRTRSITDQLSHTQESGKAKLISRMAKMGKPMLPMTGAVPAGPDSEEESVPESPQPMTEQPPQKEAVPRPVPQSHAPAQPVSQTVLQQPQFVNPQPVISQHLPQTQPAFVQSLPGAQQMALYQPQQSLLQQQQALLQQQQQLQQSQLFTGGIQSQQQPAVPGTSLPQYTFPGMGSQGSDLMLLSETRQQTTEMRLTLGKVSDKVDQVMQKLDQVQSQTASGTGMLPNMETSVLLHNIQRIVQENERLKKDVFDKSAKIESQNEKISELLQRNQSYVEKSQSLMEQRNEGFVTNTAQSQAKVLSLEKEKVELATELSTATSQISDLQMQIASLKKKEYELSTQINSSNKDSSRQLEELVALRTQHTEDESRMSDLTRQCREEKQSRKAVENSLAQLQEEMGDLKSAKESLEKNLSERKKKAAEERRRLEDELEDVKNNLEAEVQSLKEKLRKQKTSTNVATAEQVSQMEEEINRDWKIKSDKLLAVAAEKHTRQLQEVKEEKSELEKSVQDLELKIQNLRRSSSSAEQKENQLQEQLDEMKGWKDKYEALRGQATTMKQRYEDRIREVEEERDTLEEKVERHEEELPRLRQQVQQLQTSVGTTGATAGAPSGGSLIDEVKKIMNTVYRDLREQFEAEETYTGAQILAAILNAIKTTTLSLMQRQQQKSVDTQESEDEADDDDDEEEEEEEEEGEEEKKEEEEAINEETVQERMVQQKEEPEKHDDDEEEEEEKEESSKDNSEDVKEEEKDGEPEREMVQAPVVETEETKEDENVVSGAGDPGSVAENPVTEESTGETTATADERPPSPVMNGSGDNPPRQRTVSTDSLEAALDNALDKGSKVMSEPVVSLIETEPPPLMGGSSESDDDNDQQLFGDDDHVAETLGIKPQAEDAEKKASEANKKKTDRLLSNNDEDLKPKPPSLFPDDDDDDDLDWLS